MTSAHPNLTASRGELDTVVQQINHNLLNATSKQETAGSSLDTV